MNAKTAGLFLPGDPFSLRLVSLSAGSVGDLDRFSQEGLGPKNPFIHLLFWPLFASPSSRNCRGGRFGRRLGTLSDSHIAVWKRAAISPPACLHAYLEPRMRGRTSSRSI